MKKGFPSEEMRFLINGKNYQLSLEPRVTLLKLLRDGCALTGTKRSCGIGQCGACTVLVDGQPTLSCSTLAVGVKGKSIKTIEGLANGPHLHPIQQAFIGGTNSSVTMSPAWSTV